jgi:hypothetical protein
VVAAIVRTNRDFAASFTALDFSSTMRECAGGLAVCVRTKEMGRTYFTVASAALQTGEAYARMRNCYCFDMRREWPWCNSRWVLRQPRLQERRLPATTQWQTCQSRGVSSLSSFLSKVSDRRCMERESDRESVSVREGQAVGLLQEEYVGIVRRGPREIRCSDPIGRWSKRSSRMNTATAADCC